MKVTVYKTVDQWSDTIPFSIASIRSQNMFENLTENPKRSRDKHLFINKGHMALSESFSTDLGVYESYTKAKGHSVGPLVLKLFIDK